VRPEHVRISDLGEMRGEVFSVEYMGTVQIVTINTKHGQLKARIASRQRVRVGEAVGSTSTGAPRGVRCRVWKRDQEPFVRGVCQWLK